MAQATGLRIGLLTAWSSRLGGGVFEAVVAHATLLRAEGHAVTVFALEDEHSAADRDRFPAGVDLVVRPTAGPALFGYAPGLAEAMTAAPLDLVHLHGIWKYPSMAGARWAARSGRPYVVSPHGMLDPWIVARGRARKLVARIAYERASWTRAALFHALTDSEAADIRAQTGRDAVAVVPNAIFAADTAGIVRDAAAPFILFLGRIHPKKNLSGLFDGWAAARADGAGADWRLTIAGWGEDGDVAAFTADLARRGDASIDYVGAAYGADKARLLGGARFFALPSFSEGLPVAVLEAWAAGTPGLISRHCNLRFGFASGAAIDCGTEPATIAAALTRAFAQPEAAWTAMSAAAAALASDRYAPHAVGRRWSVLYRDLVAAGLARRAA